MVFKGIAKVDMECSEGKYFGVMENLVPECVMFVCTKSPCGVESLGKLADLSFIVYGVAFKIPTTIPLPSHFFNPLPQQTTPTPTPTALEVTTIFPALPDFSSIFKFNNRVTKLETDLSEIKEEVKTQLPQILPKAVSDFATPMIEQNVTESLEAVVLARSSSQPKSTYEAAASLSEYELTKIFLDKMEESKLHLRADYKRKLYDALVESYNTDKYLSNTYGEVFILKRSRDDKDKDQDLFDGSDRGTKRRKSSKEAESQKDPRLKERKSTSSSKDTSRSHHKSSGKSSYTEEPSHTVDDSGVQNNQEFDMGNNDEQPGDEAAPKNDWFKKPKQTLNLNPDWNKRQQVDFQPPQTWISVTARAEKPPTSFDELIDTPIDFSAFIMNRLNITNMTQELLVGPAFILLKVTCKSITELEYHFEECSQARTERLDWHNPEGKPYPFDLRNPLPLIPDHRGRQVIPQDYFINNDLEYLKGGSLSRQYLTSITKTKAATYKIKWIEDMGVKRQRFYKFASNSDSMKDVYSKKRIIAVTRLKIVKRYDYGYWDEIEIRREYQQLYKFKEDKCFDLNVALRMFTRRIVIQRRVEDLQLGVKSYQKKINLTKLDTFRSNLKNRTTYTAYSDPQGVIYKDQNNRNRLIRTNELNKFSVGTLNDVRTALHDITSGIMMEYLLKREWSGLDKLRSNVMIHNIDKLLFERRLMRNLEKFVGGREYGNDLKLLK
ncbi:hypothetical protein Tco_1017148 [Tanacetum coccineum]|uniref:Uncharacterized protein n=1 Tax=Tanacetum coccineum TaxID=301880 RepID=A0ABQ5FQP6_9ASTR